MSDSQIQRKSENPLVMTEHSSKDHRHRMNIYIEWLAQTGREWHNPDLTTYRDYLQGAYSGRDGTMLSASSIRAHLSTVRGRYQTLLRDNRTRDTLYQMTPGDASPSDRKAFVDEIIQRIENAIEPENSSIKVVTRQDRPDEDHIRLTQKQAQTLLASPGMNTPAGIRDTALISLLLCTGIREAELCALNVPDLRRKLSGETALHIRRGKGCKERLVPYGNLIWVLEIIDHWLNYAQINEGAVFRGFFRGYTKIRKTGLNVRTVNKILDQYPQEIDGKIRKVNPHDLRRTYARRLYDAGTDLLAIRDNLGHADTRTTLNYIGAMDIEARKPPAIYEFDFTTTSVKHPTETD